MSVFKIAELNALLIHIPKTGGTSLRKGVFSDIDGPYYGRIPQKYRSLFKFAFVREPIDRFLSCVAMFRFGTADEDGSTRRVRTANFSVDQAIDVLYTPDLNFGKDRETFEEKFLHHALPMTHPFNVIDQADFVGRFENIRADFEKVCLHCGLAVAPPLPLLHRSKESLKIADLDKRQLSRLIAYYEQDYARFGYTIPAV